MKCSYIKVNNKGEKIVKQKAIFKTFEGALARCNIMNAKSSNLIRIRPYLCDECGNFHIGRTGKKITLKYRKKVIEELSKPLNLLTPINIKIVGKIDFKK